MRGKSGVVVDVMMIAKLITRVNEEEHTVLAMIYCQNRKTILKSFSRRMRVIVRVEKMKK